MITTSGSARDGSVDPPEHGCEVRKEEDSTLWRMLPRFVPIRRSQAVRAGIGFPGKLPEIWDIQAGAGQYNPPPPSSAGCIRARKRAIPGGMCGYYILALSAPSNNYYMQRKLHELQQWTEEIITVGREGISALARCIRQFVQTVEKNVRFPSSPPRGDLFTVTSAFRNTGSPGSKSKKPFLPYLPFSLT
jgi:hypothetical protein